MKEFRFRYGDGEVMICGLEIAGEVTDLESAVAFVREYARKSVG